MTSNTDDLEMQSIRAEVGDSGATPIERHSQQPSSSTTLNATISPEPPHTQSEVDDGGVTPVERHSQQPSSSTTLNDVISPGHPRTQPLHGQPRIAVTIPNANTRSDEHPEHHAPTSVSTNGPQITSRSENNAGHKKFENAEEANPCSGKNEPIVPEIQTVQVVGQPTGWAAMAEDIRKYDEDKVKECRDDIDTLMTFAGLFSAAITAFLVESYQALLPNRADETLQVLRFIAQQNLIANGRNSSLDLALLPSVAASGMASSNGLVLVNILWFASLISSLVAASFSMLVKHWLREYLAVNNPSAQARLRVRRCREPSLTVWKVFEIAAALPFLLQLALALFFAGLCIFTTSVHTTVGRTTTALVCAWAFCFLAVTMLPIFFPRCPYKTTFLSRLMRWAHIHLPEGLKSNNYPDEKILMKNPSYDLEILADVDALQGDDELLGTTILESIGQFHRPQLPNLINFLRKILNHRCQIVRAGDVLWLVNSDLQSLTDRGKKAIRDIIAKYAHAEDTPTIATPKMEDGTSPLDQICAFLLSPNLQPLSDACVHLLRMRLNGRFQATKVFTALLKQLDSRSTDRAEWCRVVLDTLRYIQDVLDLNLDKAFEQFLIVMEAFHSYSRPDSPQKGTPYSWVEAFSPSGITDIGVFLCRSVGTQLKRTDAHSINHADERLNSLRQATRCVLYLKQFRGTLKPVDSAAMQAEIAALLVATFATEDTVLAGAVLTECIQQKDTLYEQVLHAALIDTRQLLIESGQVKVAFATFGSLIRNAFLPQNRKTLNRYLKLCFIAICLVPPSDSETIVTPYDDLFTSFACILSRCLEEVDESSHQNDVTLQRLCLAQLKTSNITHGKLSTTLEKIDHALQPVSSMTIVPAKDVSRPYDFKGGLPDRSRTTNPLHHAMRQALQFVDVPRRRDSASAVPIVAPPITPSVAATNTPLPHLAPG